MRAAELPSGLLQTFRRGAASGIPSILGVGVEQGALHSTRIFTFPFFFVFCFWLSVCDSASLKTF